MPSITNAHRRALAALALAALVVAAGCAGAVGETSDATTAGTDAAPASEGAGADTASASGKSITVAAAGSVTADPDRAVVRVAARATADSASVARERVAENVSALRAALADAGVPDDRVTTENYNIRQTRQSRESARTEYRATHTLAVEVANVSRVGEVIRTAVESGASEVQYVEYTLSEEKRDELRDRALTRAMSNARDDADVLASNANLSLVGVDSVSTGGADVRPYRAELTAAAADGGSGATSIDSGPVTVSANVEVTYEATD